mmetsp:Transcript_47450/g.94073  ORF Transcript_47450/g.94073 Transcript_47450/m.94073 type:complete len:213 (-) Transcript_47450:368-1006(-)
MFPRSSSSSPSSSSLSSSPSRGVEVLLVPAPPPLLLLLPPPPLLLLLLLLGGLLLMKGDDGDGGVDSGCCSPRIELNPVATSIRRHRPFSTPGEDRPFCLALSLRLNTSCRWRVQYPRHTRPPHASNRAASTARLNSSPSRVEHSNPAVTCFRSALVLQARHRVDTPNGADSVAKPAKASSSSRRGSSSESVWSMFAPISVSSSQADTLLRL